MWDLKLNINTQENDYIMSTYFQGVTNNKQMKIRTGIGYDVHQLVEGREFWLGGVKIKHDKGSLGHSDGDALIHAICDALFGAANMNDIGYHFPDTSSEYKGIAGKILLRRTVNLLKEKKYKISNIDSIVVLQAPKIKDYINEMKTAIAGAAQIDIDDISIKATTTEKLGFAGRKEGVAAYANVLIYKNL